MTNVLQQIRRLNGLGTHAVAEPFAGGAGASLMLLYLEETPSIHLNDADRAIHDFWWAVANRNREFVEKLLAAPLTVDEWHRQRTIYRTTQRVSRLDRGFAAFYLNRCNRSGIIRDGSLVGGIEQAGVWKMDARFNKATLRKRLEKLVEYRTRIHISNLDGIALIESLGDTRTFFFIDPPYFHKGPTLYLNSLDVAYHTTLAEHLHSLSDAPWVLTYDDCPEIRSIYAGWANVRPFALRYSASERRQGQELMITPPWMKVPDSQMSNAITW